MHIYVALFIFILSCSLHANPRFSDTAQVMQRYDYNSGLSQVSVTSLAQDQFGYIWIGTQAGLNRFDGHEFRQFESVQQSNVHLAGGFITSLCQDKDMMWIGTSTGLSVYHSNKGIFQSFLASDSQSISSDRVEFIDCKTDRVVITTEVGQPYVIFQNSLEIMDPKISGKDPRNVIYRDGIYYFIDDQGLYSQKEGTETLELLLAGQFKQFKITHSRIYLFTFDSGLIVYDLSLKREEWRKVFQPVESSVLNDITVSADKITLATGNGVYLLNFDGDVQRHWTKTDKLQQGLQDNNVLSVMRDNEDDLWIGTESRGLHFLTKLSDSFGHVGEFNYVHSPIVSPDVRSFALDTDGTFWVATSDGLSIFDGFGFVNPAQIYSQLVALEHVFITKIFAHKHYLWITTRGSGIFRLDLNTSRLENWKPEFNGALELNFNDVYYYNHEVLVSSRGHGLLKYDAIENQFHSFFDPTLFNAPNHVTSVRSSGKSLIFGSVGEGIFKFEDGILSNLNTQTGLASDIVFMIEIDDKGRVWAASEAGLTITQNNFKTERIVKKSDGLANDAIWSLVFDGKSHVWLGTSGGLSQINIDDYTIYNFLPFDGVQDYEFNYNAAWLAPDGRVFIGGAKGFNQFYPEHIAIKQRKNDLIISEIAVLGETLKPSDGGLINTATELTSRINLEHDQNIISLQYSSLEFTSDKQMKYFYRVIGLSDQWLRLAKGSRQVNLLKLEPGIYQVEVYTVNRFNQHSPIHQTQIKVNAPLWWNTWSKLLYLALLIALVAYNFHLRQKRFAQVVEDNKKMADLKERLELSLWASGDELWDWHLKTKNIYRHRVMPRIDYGCAFEYMQVEDISAFVHPKDSINLEDKLEACIRGEEDSYEVPLRVKDLSGKWVWVLDRGKVVNREKNGVATRIAGALKDITELKSHQDALQRLNEQLEIKVAMRTDELYKKNQKLEQAMIELKRTQQELIESERMASLGNLVAGVAHEINTPLGVAITALTYNMECLSQIDKKLQDKTLKQSDLDKAIQEQNNGYALIMRNLDRAQSLIGNFKQVAVDQSSETEREINLKEYVIDVFDSLTPLVKGKGITIDINGGDDIILNTYPGAIYQILTNLLNNSVIHGFENLSNGHISTSILAEKKAVVITYHDNGVGVNPKIITNIFDPFVTSKRNQGGCGLGMHIVYNLVTQLLKGEIKCTSEPGSGVKFVIRIPIF
ncbi:hypothetical protein PALB_30730 [Pseudoalteromonas luteoviolacea B = ATCC 29581]|nr:hypothetical protein PALB_30730 [Pseudoalteromonas luteoviolacea B = ATCC 29581]